MNEIAHTRANPLVLVADDEVNTTVMLEHIFEREGYSVERVNNGIAALNKAQILLPDLILLDIMMPGMNGFDVLRALREDSTTAGIPTILVTAQAREPADVARGLNLGADDYLYKPFAPQELLARAQSKIKTRKLEADLQRRTQDLSILLRASEQLNQKLNIHELVRVIFDLISEMLPISAAVIYLVDEVQALKHVYVHEKAALSDSTTFQSPTTVSTILKQKMTYMWPDQKPLLAAFEGGLITPLQQADHRLGALMIVNQSPYDEHYLRLFEGLASQIALALRNAQLYEIQAKYAANLEDMVAERTEELKSAQEMLIRSEKLASIGHLAASIAHEINNPLMPIRNLLEEIFEDIAQYNVPIDTKAVTLIHESLERIRRIVSQLLDFAGKRNQGPDLQLIEISPILSGIVDLNRKFFEGNRIKIEAELPELPAIYGSKDQLEQVFMNLALNAQAAMEGGGKLKIQARADDKDIIVKFEDTGIGIPSEQLTKIFDPFFSTKPTGTGLGLFVSYGIIQGHNGTISVESTVNVGTKFTIRLPLNTTDPSLG
jgi:signal transduction histidine kinase